MKATPEDVAKLVGATSIMLGVRGASMKATPEDVAKIPLVIVGFQIIDRPQ